ncbi:MAG: hypothetical protein IKK39_01210, partial [Thermoguttaceae bacterium]|nr:hypothetical protein [Thermoguttaceae bacterium]
MKIGGGVKCNDCADSSKGEKEATVIAWIWTRTVKCPNPACGCETPLAHSFALSSKKGNEFYVEPLVENGSVSFQVKPGKEARPGTISRKGAKCVVCDSPISLDYVREEGKARRLNARLMAIVAEGP